MDDRCIHGNLERKRDAISYVILDCLSRLNLHLTMNKCAL